MAGTGLTKDEKMAAYELVKETFDLTWRQRDALDASPLYDEIMQAAHDNDLVRTGVLLSRAKIV